MYAVAYRRPQHLFGYVWQQSLSHNRAMPLGTGGGTNCTVAAYVYPFFLAYPLLCTPPEENTRRRHMEARHATAKGTYILHPSLLPPPPLDYAICHGGWYQPTTVLLFLSGKVSFFLGKVVVYSSRQVQESYQGNK